MRSSTGPRPTPDVAGPENHVALRVAYLPQVTADLKRGAIVSLR